MTPLARHTLGRFLALADLSVIVTVAGAGCAAHGTADVHPLDAQLASAQLGNTASAASATPSDAPPLFDRRAHRELEAVVSPPAGWRPDPIKRSRSHSHQTWLSPTGHTAYGVIKINLPLPFLGPDAVLKPFLNEMKKTEGEAKLISRRNDPRLGGLRFVAEGGQYRLRSNLMTRGFRAWAVYAGTRRGQEEMLDELQLAEQARERTKIGSSRGR
jgi:hypothetical protein